MEGNADATSNKTHEYICLVHVACNGIVCPSRSQVPQGEAMRTIFGRKADGLHKVRLQGYFHQATDGLQSDYSGILGSRAAGKERRLDGR